MASECVRWLDAAKLPAEPLGRPVRWAAGELLFFSGQRHPFSLGTAEGLRSWRRRDMAERNDSITLAHKQLNTTNQLAGFRRRRLSRWREWVVRRARIAWCTI
jgi:hypothetical protein